ncbi:MAG: hypothetical protein HFH49_05890 [Lachnospiraceae bacterium]|nr:hypothetical protein [Lachnospiraceae bacterium]
MSRRGERAGKGTEGLWQAQGKSRERDRRIIAGTGKEQGKGPKNYSRRRERAGKGTTNG